MEYAKYFLSQTSFWQVNKLLTNKLKSIEASVFLSDLIDKEKYHGDRDELIEVDGKIYFYATSEDIEDTTTLSYKIQKKCIKILLEHELIETKLMGMPAKLHFTICTDKIGQLFKTSIAQKSKQVLPKSQLNNNRINNNNILEKELKNILAEQGILFPDEDIKKETVFTDSFVFNETVWCKMLKKEIALGIDVMYYHQAIWDWNETLRIKNPKKYRTASGWLATARNFIKKDKEKNKVKMQFGKQQEIFTQAQIDYLKL